MSTYFEKKSQLFLWNVFSVNKGYLTCTHSHTHTHIKIYSHVKYYSLFFFKKKLCQLSIWKIKLHTQLFSIYKNIFFIVIRIKVKGLLKQKLFVITQNISWRLAISHFFRNNNQAYLSKYELNAHTLPMIDKVYYLKVMSSIYI